jgi:hypothetical protein
MELTFFFKLYLVNAQRTTEEQAETAARDGTETEPGGRAGRQEIIPAAADPI